MRWLIESYTVVLAYLAVTSFGWYVDYRIGLSLAVCLPVAFALGRGSALDHR